MAPRHENLFRLVMRDPARAGAWLRTVLLQGTVKVIDWRSLAPAAEKLVRDTLRLDEVDLLFRARFIDGAPLWILVEHKSSLDRITDQLGRYVFELRRTLPFPGGRLPVPVLPVVAYHGESPMPLRFPPDVLFADPDASTEEVVEALEPELPIFVDDLIERGERGILETPLDAATKLVLLCLGRLGQFAPGDVPAALLRWREVIVAVDRDESAAPGQDILRGVMWYCLTRTDAATDALRDTFETLLNRPDDYIMGTAERIRREAYEQGEAQGEARGRADVLLRLFARRFGAPGTGVAERVRSASTTDLDRWIERILDVTTADELFVD